MLRKLNSEGKYKAIITKETLRQRERIVGGLNMVLFQLGFLGLFLPLSIYLAMSHTLSLSLALSISVDIHYVTIEQNRM